MKKLQEISRIYRVERVRENMDLCVDNFKQHSLSEYCFATLEQHRSTSTTFSNRNVVL
jgi:hypothetical protein